MQGLEERLKEIVGKVENLVGQRDEMKIRLVELQDEVQALKQEIGSLQEQVREKTRYIHILQTANSLNSRDNKEEAKHKVDDLLREIDHCLTILDS